MSEKKAANYEPILIFFERHFILLFQVVLYAKLSLRNFVI